MKKYLEDKNSLPIKGHSFYQCEGLLVQDNPLPYDYKDSYWDYYQSLRGSETERHLNQIRTELVGPNHCVLDIGIGNGSWLLSYPHKGFGSDINPLAVEWLYQQGCYVDPWSYIPKTVDTFCFWDCLEHFAAPSTILDLIPRDKFVCVSLPIFDDLLKVKESKHFKPHEHCWYATSSGIQTYMEFKGFECLEVNTKECDAGREGIKSFKFVKRCFEIL